jgi:TolA-binding protein
MTRLRCLSLLLAAAWLGAGCAGDPAPVNDEDLFQSALADYEAMRFADAQAKFDQLVAEFPDSPRHDNAGYLAGRCRYALLDFAGAITTLVEMRGAHPTSPFVDSAAYFTGRARFRLGSFAEAIPDFEASLEADPQGTYADNAAYYVGRSEYEAGLLAAAIADLGAFETAYPDSSYVDNARFYLGYAHYDNLDYQAAIDAFVTVFDVAGSAYADNAQFLIGRSHQLLAQPDVALADYEALIADYPGTLFGDNALYYEITIHVDRLDCVSADVTLSRLADTYPGSNEITAAETYMAGGGC